MRAGAGGLSCYAVITNLCFTFVVIVVVISIDVINIFAILVKVSIVCLEILIRISLGTIGVLGPTRMDYPQALATVDTVSDRLARRLSEGAN